jgi:hypothetical protein
VVRIVQQQVVAELRQQVMVLQDQVSVVPVELEYHLVLVIMPEVVAVDQVVQVRLVEPVELAVVEILNYVFQQKMEQIILVVVVLELFNLLVPFQVVVVDQVW